MRTSSFFLLAAVAGVAAAADAPQQIHLAYGAPSYSSMTVSWVTNNVTATSVVKYGLSPSSLTSTAAAPEPPTTYLYTYDHHVTLTGLSPKTVYYYSCGDSAAGFSAVFNFTTAPEPNGEFPFKVAVFADMGNWNSNATFIDLQRLLQPASGGDLETAFILQAGDISYADDAFLHDPLVFGYENAWNTYMTHMQGVGGAWKPLMVAPGNHEAECHSPICFLDTQKRDAVANFTAYNHRFRMPSAGSTWNSGNAGTMNMWYSYDYGSVHFVHFSAETDYPNAPNDDYSSKNGNFGDQLAWIEADLAAAAKKRAAGEVSWIIAAAHRPVYSMAEFDPLSGSPSGSASHMQAAFEPLFAKYGVDVYFSGHVHGTEVHWPVYNSTSVQRSFNNPPYTTYFVIGGAGCDEGLTNYGAPNATLWSNFYDGSNYGLSTVTFQDADTMVYQFRRATDGATLKQVTLVRQH